MKWQEALHVEYFIEYFICAQAVSTYDNTRNK